MPIITINDMTGLYEVPKDKFTEPRFDAIRDEKQYDMIVDMLGAELSALYIADLNANGVPTAARFLALYNALNSDSGCGIVKSEGIKAMVKGLVYYYYARENNFRVAIAGNVGNKGENSGLTRTAAWFVNKYNQAVATAHAIQWYIGQNSATYPEYNGTEIEFLSLV